MSLWLPSRATYGSERTAAMQRKSQKHALGWCGVQGVAKGKPGRVGVLAHRIRAGFEARGRIRPICLFRNQRIVSLISRWLRKPVGRFLNKPFVELICRSQR
jgi:hypothetical protein